MKKLVLALVFLGLPVLAFAATSSLNFMQIVVSSDAAKELAEAAASEGFSELVKVERTAVYRCPGCFDYELTFRQYADGVELEMTRTVFTRLVLQTGEVEVTLKDVE